MKRKPSDRITLLVYGSDRLLLLVLFCFMTGIAMGAFTELLLSDDAKENIQGFLDLHLPYPGLWEISCPICSWHRQLQTSACC